MQFCVPMKFSLTRSNTILNTLPLAIYLGSAMAQMGHSFAFLSRQIVSFDVFLSIVCELWCATIGFQLAMPNLQDEAKLPECRDKCGEIEDRFLNAFPTRV